MDCLISILTYFKKFGAEGFLEVECCTHPYCNKYMLVNFSKETGFKIDDLTDNGLDEYSTIVFYIYLNNITPDDQLVIKARLQTIQDRYTKTYLPIEIDLVFDKDN